MVTKERNSEPLIGVEIGFSRKALQYIDTLVDKDGFGGSRAAVVRNFVWKEINRLIEMKRLDEIK